MLHALIELLLFSAKTFVIALLIIIIFVGFFALLAKAKEKIKGRLTIRNINKKHDETTEMILAETLSKKEFKTFLKQKKAETKLKLKQQKKPTVYVLNFNGDIKASAVNALREEITAILNVATKHDEVVLCLESAGGMVHAYGLAA